MLHLMRTGFSCMAGNANQIPDCMDLKGILTKNPGINMLLYSDYFCFSVIIILKVNYALPTTFNPVMDGDFLY